MDNVHHFLQYIDVCSSLIPYTVFFLPFEVIFINYVCLLSLSFNS